MIVARSRLGRIGEWTLLIGVSWIVVLAIGVQIGLSHAENIAARNLRTVPTATAAANLTSTPDLRCAQSPSGELRPWTRVDAEAQVRAAREFLETAEAAHVPSIKQAWAAQAQATLMLLDLCWDR